MMNTMKKIIPILIYLTHFQLNGEILNRGFYISPGIQIGNIFQREPIGVFKFQPAAITMREFIARLQPMLVLVSLWGLENIKGRI